MQRAVYTDNFSNDIYGLLCYIIGLYNSNRYYLQTKRTANKRRQNVIYKQTLLKRSVFESST